MKMFKHLLSLFARSSYVLLLTLIVKTDAVADELHAAIVPVEAAHVQKQPSGQRVYASIINDSDTVARNCGIALRDAASLELNYWATQATTNFIVGERNTPVDIAPRASQSFLLTLSSARAEFGPVDHAAETRIEFDFNCDTHASAQTVRGVNDLLLTAEASSLLLALATANVNDIVELSTRLGSNTCTGIRLGLNEPESCAAGVMALALRNVAETNSELVIDLVTDGPNYLLCVTDPTGECVRVGEANTGLQLALESNEVVTLSAFFLTFRDEYFGLVRQPREVGVNVFEANTQPLGRGPLVASARTELTSPAFEWSAVRGSGLLTVQGSLAVADSCTSGRLEPDLQVRALSGELRLALRLVDPEPLTVCTQALRTVPVSWQSEGPVDDIRSVVVGLELDSNESSDGGFRTSRRIPEPLVIPVVNLD